MAGGYSHSPDGVEGFAAVLKDLQRQIDSLKAGSPLQSATIGVGGLTVFDPDTGARQFFGGGSIAMWDDFNSNPDGFGRIYCDPVSGANLFRIFPPYTDGGGLTNSITIKGDAPGAPGNLWLYTDGVLSLVTQDKNANPSGSVYIKSPAVTLDTSQLALYSLPTTGSSANLRLDTIGGKWTVGYVTSSRRYKQNIQDAGVDPAAVLKMRGRTWRQRADVKADPDTTVRNVGFIAEELHDLGLGVFVDYDDEGRADAIQYDRLSVGLLEVAKAQQSQIDALTKRVDALEASR